MSRLEEWNAFKDSVRDANPLRELMTEGGEKFNRQDFILCPFHSEKSPSCHLVGDHDEAFYCFGCGANGDVIEFVQKRERVDFKGAVDFLAARVGKSWENQGGEAFDEETQAALDNMIEGRRVENMITESAQFFHRTMPSKVRAWIKKQYGFDDETIDRKLIGFGNGESLMHWLKEEQGYSEAKILQTGLFIKTASGIKGFFDDRVTFPYLIRGRAKYMIARKTEWTSDDEYEKGKYKKQITGGAKFDYVSKHVSNEWFYGEDDSRGNVELLVITEGVTDCVSVQMLGIRCISPVTVRFKKSDLPKLLQLCHKIPKVVVCNDNDTNAKGQMPGLVGAVDTVGFLFENGIDARLAQLPKAAGVAKIDNNEYIRALLDEAHELVESDPKRFAREKLLKVYANAKSYPQYKIEEVPTGLDPTEMADRLKPIFKIVATCGPVERDGYATSIARRFNISKGSVASSIRELLPEAERRDDDSPAAGAVSGEGRGGGGHDDDIIRGQIVADVEHYYVKTKKWDEVISTFVLAPKKVVRFEDEYLIECGVKAKGVGHEFTLQLARKSFESKREFIRSFRHPAMQWTGGDDNVQSLLSTLRTHELVERKGVKTLGYHMTPQGPVWVTANYVFNADGIVEDPEVTYVDHGAPLADRLEYEFPDDDEVKRLAEYVMPRMLGVNEARIMVPAIGWWFASVLKKPISERLGHFPLLFIYGTAGCGKTSLAKEVLWPMSGVSQRKNDMFSCTDTMFALARNSASTASIVLPFDEFRPDMGRQNIEKIQRYARRVYNGDIEMRGRQDQGVNQFSLQAPSCIIGEARPEGDPALIERLVLVNPDKFALTPERATIYKELTTSGHGRLAGPLVQFALQQDVDALIVKSRGLTDEILKRMRRAHVLPHRCYDNMLVVVMGLNLFEAFAAAHDVALPSIDYVAVFNAMLDESLEGGNGMVKDNFDHLLEEASTLSHLGLLTEGREYTLVDGELNLFLPAIYKRYIDERRRSGKEDATNGMRALKKVAFEKLTGGGGYILSIDKRVKFPDGGQRRCIVIDPRLVPQTLDFEQFAANASETRERKSWRSDWEQEPQYGKN